MVIENGVEVSTPWEGYLQSRLANINININININTVGGVSAIEVGSQCEVKD